MIFCIHLYIINLEVFYNFSTYFTNPKYYYTSPILSSKSYWLAIYKDPNSNPDIRSIQYSYKFIIRNYYWEISFRVLLRLFISSLLPLSLTSYTFLFLHSQQELFSNIIFAGQSAFLAYSSFHSKTFFLLQILIPVSFLLLLIFILLWILFNFIAISNVVVSALNNLTISLFDWAYIFLKIHNNLYETKK